MQPEGSLPHSQVPATFPYPEPALSYPYPQIPLPEDPSCPPFHFSVRTVPQCQSRSEASVHDFKQNCFLQWGLVNTSPNPQAGGPPPVDCRRLLIQYIRSYPPCCRPLLHPQPEDAPCRGDNDTLITVYRCDNCSLFFKIENYSYRKYKQQNKSPAQLSWLLTSRYLVRVCHYFIWQMQLVTFCK